MMVGELAPGSALATEQDPPPAPVSLTVATPAVRTDPGTSDGSDLLGPRGDRTIVTAIGHLGPTRSQKARSL